MADSNGVYNVTQSAAPTNGATMGAVDQFFAAKDFPSVLNALFVLAISIGAVLAVLRIAYAGYLYLKGDIWGNKSKAKEYLQDAVFGLILLLAIWVILHTINPQLLNLDVLRSVN